MAHTPLGKTILSNFVLRIAGAQPSWDMASFLDSAVATIRASVGPDAHVIGAVSGGVDSTVAAALLARAVGDRFHAVMVDNGLLRKDERVQVRAHALHVLHCARAHPTPRGLHAPTRSPCRC